MKSWCIYLVLCVVICQINGFELDVGKACSTEVTTVYLFANGTMEAFTEKSLTLQTTADLEEISNLEDLEELEVFDTTEQKYKSKLFQTVFKDATVTIKKNQTMVCNVKLDCPNPFSKTSTNTVPVKFQSDFEPKGTYTLHPLFYMRKLDTSARNSLPNGSHMNDPAIVFASKSPAFDSVNPTDNFAQNASDVSGLDNHFTKSQSDSYLTYNGNVKQTEQPPVIDRNNTGPTINQEELNTRSVFLPGTSNQPVLETSAPTLKNPSDNLKSIPFGQETVSPTKDLEIEIKSKNLAQIKKPRVEPVVDPSISPTMSYLEDNRKNLVTLKLPNSYNNHAVSPIAEGTNPLRHTPGAVQFPVGSIPKHFRHMCEKKFTVDVNLTIAHNNGKVDYFKNLLVVDLYDLLVGKPIVNLDSLFSKAILHHYMEDLQKQKMCLDNARHRQYLATSKPLRTMTNQPNDKLGPPYNPVMSLYKWFETYLPSFK